jgi:hypothetical protein
MIYSKSITASKGILLPWSTYAARLFSDMMEEECIKLELLKASFSIIIGYSSELLLVYFLAVP